MDMPAPRDITKDHVRVSSDAVRKAFDDVAIRNLSEMVYRLRLEGNDAKTMVEKDGDNGEKLRSRSSSYDSLSRDYMRAAVLLGLIDL